ncbi:MAG: isopenicillin N synthase family oxygenase [Luminiphilus sp.]|nr:isopenicillin N synthase family oxygenase [Luminiphilus sp.]
MSDDGCLAFSTQADLDNALDVGVFYLKAPEDLRLERARQFGLSLLDPKSPYRDVPQYGELEGFIALENNQQTKLALRRHRWAEHYPDGIARFGGQLDVIGVAIIREVLRQSGIPESCWDRASGGYALGEGTAFLNFVHYDTRNLGWGLRAHTDYGFVTILDATVPGLQIEFEEEFHDVPVLPDHFVINFGEALNFVTSHAARGVGAVVHRVLSQQSSDPIRHGIVYFANPDLDSIVWQFDTNGEIKGSSSVENLFASLERELTE